ncbi:MAG: FAD-binding oxidoreductase [Gammaproteobacteria bacterium]
MISRSGLSVLRSVLGEARCRTDPATTLAYSYDNSRLHHRPDAVVFPEVTGEIEAIVALAAKDRIPLVARGLGSNTTGASVPVQGGVVLSTERMRAILEFAPEDQLIVVESGALNEDVQKTAATRGLFWPPDPSSASHSTVGGNIATNAGGPRAVRYGTTRDHVLGLLAVDGRGRAFRCGVRTSKSSVGYDLTRLLVGSEGTLAVITEATLHLVPCPSARLTYRAIYGSYQEATRAISAILNQPLPPSAIEFLDERALALIRSEIPEIPEAGRALLLIELEQHHPFAPSEIETFEAALGRDGLLDLERTLEDAARGRLWQVRKSLSPALRRLAPGKINEDVVVPLSRLPALVESVFAIGHRQDTQVVTFGHAGSGNLHVNLLFDPDDPSAVARAGSALSEVFSTVLDLGGAISGEHGIGLSKRPFMTAQLDPVTLDLMHELKTLFDPLGILNPGKLLPPRVPHPTSPSDG